MSPVRAIDGRVWRAALPCGALVLVAAAYLWEVLTLAGIPVARDMQMFFVPQKHILWSAFTEGRIPLWTRYIGTGAPFLANVQSGVFYPPHWLYAVLPFYTAFNLLVVLHFLLGGLFALALARRLGARPAAAYIGAVTWMLGGYFASLLNLVNALQAAAWTPAIAWAVLGTLDRPGHRSVGVLVGVTVCGLLAGEPQTFLFSTLAAGLLAALELARRPRRPVGLARAGGALVIGALVVSGLAAVQLLPTLELLRESGRTGGLTYGEAAAFALRPVRLVHLLVPPDYRDPQYAFGVRSVIGRGDPWLFSIYTGALLPVFAWFAWRRRERRVGVAVWSVVAVVAVVVALGDHTPVFRWMFDHVPGVASFRFPEKYFFWTAFAAFLLTVWGADSLLEGESHAADRWLGVGYVTLAAALVGVLRFGRESLERVAAGWGNDRMMSDFGYAHAVWSQNVLKLFVIVWLAGLLIWLFRRGTVTRPVFALLLALLVTADLAVAHRGLNPVVERSFYETPPGLFEHLPVAEIRRDFRLRTTRFDSAGNVPVIRGVPLEAQKWMWQQILVPNVGQTWDILQQDAWDAIKIEGANDERELQRVIPDARRRWALLRLHSVRYVHSILDLDPAGQARAIPLDTLPGTLWEIERPLPRAYVASTAETYASPADVINRVLSEEFDLENVVALLDTTGAAATSSGGEPGPAAGSGGGDGTGGATPAGARATITETADEEVRISLAGTIAPGSHLVLTDSRYPGWSATVDGEERPVKRANLFFRAVPLQPGDSEVRFSYRSRPYELGRAIALGTLVLALLAFAALEWRTRSRPGTRGSPAE